MTGATTRAYIAKGRVSEMRALGWTVVDTLADSDDGEWSVLMEGPELPARPMVSLAEATLRAIGAAADAVRANA